MDYKLLLDTAVMAGELMLANGAETYRVEDTMHRMLSLSGLKTAEAFVMVTGFLVTLDDPSIQSMTVTRRIQSRGTNLRIIDEINSISRGLCGGELELEEAFRQIKKAEKGTAPSPGLSAGQRRCGRGLCTDLRRNLAGMPLWRVWPDFSWPSACICAAA